MSQPYLKVRYLQSCILLGASALCLIAQGAIWFSQVMRIIEGSWVKWAFDGASILFAVAIVEFIPAVLETRFAISEGRYLSETEQQTFNKVFYSGVMGFAVGCVGLALVVYKLITHST